METRKTTEAKRRAVAKYDAATAVHYSLKVNKRTDPDIIEWMAKIENKQSYLKDLIRADIEKNK